MSSDNLSKRNTGRAAEILDALATPPVALAIIGAVALVSAALA